MSETTTNTGLGLSVVQSRGELATSAAAARAKAEIEARFVIALNRPRKILEARAAILDACKRTAFAEGAWYRKPGAWNPVTKKKDTYDGLSIRFAEMAIQAMRNISVTTTLVYEDEHARAINIAVTDLESNLCYSKDVTIAKTVERKKLKDGQEAIGERLNSNGDRVFIVAATDDELLIKIASAESKVIRNSGLRLVPADILEEAEAQILRTQETGGTDPKAAAKKIADGFHAIGVSIADLQEYLGHSVDAMSKAELIDLRKIYTAVRDGEAKFQDFLKGPAQEESEVKKPESPEPAQSSTTPNAASTAPADASQPSGEPNGSTSEQRASPSKPRTSQEQLADAVTQAGFNFDDYMSAVKHLKLMPIAEADKYQSFAEIPNATCNRHLRVMPQLLAAMREDKGMPEGGAM